MQYGICAKANPVKHNQVPCISLNQFVHLETTGGLAYLRKGLTVTAGVGVCVGARAGANLLN